jgi:hypothetical protein
MLRKTQLPGHPSVMHLDHLSRRFEKLAREGLEYGIAPGASGIAIDASESRLGATFPAQVRLFFEHCDGIEVPEPAFKLYSLAELERNGALLDFCLCDHVHRLAFDTREINEAGQWFIVNPVTGYRVTYTMASFWSIQMWSWIEKRRPIWDDFHREAGAE